MKKIVACLALVLSFSIAQAISDTNPIEPLKSNGFTAWREPTDSWKRVGTVSLDPANPSKLTWADGTENLVNFVAGRSKDLFTKEEFGDIELHIEFMIPKKSNSGVLLMGRYELQIYDSFGVAKDEYPGIECGGIYPRWIDNQRVGGHSPLVNASLEPGHWQTFDVTFRAPHFDAAGKKTANGVFVKVLHNGKLIHENIEVTGPTRSSAYKEEGPTGPLMLQGDHGPVAFRNIRIRALSNTVETSRNPTQK